MPPPLKLVGVSEADLASAMYIGHGKYVLSIVSMKNQVHLIGKRIKEIELKCRVVMKAALSILLTMALPSKMLKCNPKSSSI